MYLYTKQGPLTRGLPRLVWKNSSGLRKALTSIPLNTLGVNWNADCTIPAHPTPVNDLTNALVSELANPHSHEPETSKKSF